MDEREVFVVKTGTANLASVCAALRRLKAEPRLTDRPVEVDKAKWLVLPGVGGFAAAAKNLACHGLDAVLARRILQGRPTLTICLGMQLLGLGSDESPGIHGLGVIPTHVGRFPGNLRVPHMGWNRVEVEEGADLLRSGYAYFANSYRLTSVPATWQPAYTMHGERFVAAAERGKVLACQFHPELSGDWGLQLIARWLGRHSEDFRLEVDQC